MDSDYEWQYRRKKRHLEPHLQILIVVLVASVAVAVMSCVAPTEDRGREVSIAARACFDAGQRAILHTDGSIECRP